MCLNTSIHNVHYDQTLSLTVKLTYFVVEYEVPKNYYNFACYFAVSPGKILLI